LAIREEWIGRTGQEWARRADAIELLLDLPGRAGLAALAAAPGERIIDLGCGAGSSTEALARTVGPVGAVTGIDISPDLAARARARVAGYPQARIVEADAQTWRPSGAFDALYSRFGSMFFDDPPTAFGNLHAALAPGARAVFVAWRDPRRNQWATIPMAFASESLTDVRSDSGPGPFAWADPAVHRKALTAGGFVDVSERPFDFTAELGDGDDPDPVRRAVAFMMRIGPLAARLRGAPEETRREAEAFLADRLARRVCDGAIRLEASAWIITARAGCAQSSLGLNASATPLMQ